MQFIVAAAVSLCPLIAIFQGSIFIYFFMCMCVFAICMQGRDGLKGELKLHIGELGDSLCGRIKAFLQQLILVLL